jgi:hypothetical protein
MHFARTTAWALALLLTAGCNTSQHATLYREGEKQIKVTVLSKTGDGIPVTDERELPSGVEQARFGATRLEVGEYLHAFILRSGGARTVGGETGQ